MPIPRNDERAEPRTKRRLRIGAFAALQVVLSATVVAGYAALIEANADQVEYFDYFTLHVSARQADLGRDPYAPMTLVVPHDDGAGLWVRHPNLNPPIVVAAMIPFSRLPARAGYIVFNVFALTLAGLSLPLLIATAGSRENPLRRGLDLFLLLGLFFPFYLSVRLGQMGHPLLLPVALGWWAFRDERDALAGTALGVAFAVKLFFGLFGLLFLVGRRWRALGAMVLTSLVISSIGPMLLGWSTLVSYARTVASVEWFASPWNASLLGFLSRVLSVPATSGWRGLEILGALLWAVAVAVALAAVARRAECVRGRPSPEARDTAFAVTLVAMLVISPLSWAYYLTLLVIPLVAVTRGHARRRSRALVALGWLLCAIPFDQNMSPDLPLGDRLTLQGGFAFYGLIMILVAVLLMNPQCRDAPRRARGTSVATAH